MRLLLTLGTILALSGCAVIVTPDNDDARFETVFSDARIKGNGDIVTEQRPVGSFPILEIRGPMQVEVRIGAAPSLQIEGDSNLVALIHIDTDTSGAHSKLLPLSATGATLDILKISADEKIDRSSAVRVIYTVQQLNRVSAQGAGRLMVRGLNGGNLALTNDGSRSVQLSGKVQRLDLRASGSGSINAAALDSGTATVSGHGSAQLNLGAVRGDELNVTLHGSGSLHASGAVHTLNARLHGSGMADLSALRSDDADLSTYGSGDLLVTTAHSVVAQSAGSGRITVYGNPLQRTVTGTRVSIVQ